MDKDSAPGKLLVIIYTISTLLTILKGYKNFIESHASLTPRNSRSKSDRVDLEGYGS
jgi:hypothetical protein